MFKLFRRQQRSNFQVHNPKGARAFTVHCHRPVRFHSVNTCTQCLHLFSSTQKLGDFSIPPVLTRLHAASERRFQPEFPRIRSRGKLEREVHRIDLELRCRFSLVWVSFGPLFKYFCHTFDPLNF